VLAALKFAKSITLKPAPLTAGNLSPAGKATVEIKGDDELKVLEIGAIDAIKEVAWLSSLSSLALGAGGWLLTLINTRPALDADAWLASFFSISLELDLATPGLGAAGVVEMGKSVSAATEVLKGVEAKFS
jgi:hypothetical protein